MISPSFHIMLLALTSPLFHGATAVTLAARPRCVSRSRHFTARYDNLPYDSNAPSNAIPYPYQRLAYENFSVADEANNLISAASGSQFAISYGGSGVITPAFANTTLSLRSFSYACDAGIPQPACKINLTGTKSSSPSPVHTSLVFPQLDPGHRFGEFVMNSTKDTVGGGFGREWAGLRELRWSIERASDGGDVFGALVLDDFEYTVKDVKDGC